MKPRRNYRITGLVPHPELGVHTVEVERAGARIDTGTPASGWGTWGLPRAERGILRQGLTATGRDRRPR